MKVIHDGKKAIIECNIAELSHITDALRNYDDLGHDMSEKMQNENEVIKPEVSGG